MRPIIPSGKQPHNYGKSPFLMGKVAISMAMFNGFLYVYQRVIPSKPGSITPHGNQLTRLFLMPHVRSVLPSNWCHGVVLDPPSLGQEKMQSLQNEF